MTDLINGRTPEEIKAGLKACTTAKVPGYGCNIPCPYLNTPNCWLPVKSDALALIERLEAERDALTANEYQREALRTAGEHVGNSLLVNGVMGLNGEAGECIDIVKKHLFQEHELDKEKLAKELGDVAWYLAVTAHAIGYTLEDVMLMNIEKLKARYPEGFDPEKSLHRKEGDV